MVEGDEQGNAWSDGFPTLHIFSSSLFTQFRNYFTTYFLNWVTWRRWIMEPPCSYVTLMIKWVLRFGQGRKKGWFISGGVERGESGQWGRSFPPKVSLSPPPPLWHWMICDSQHRRTFPIVRAHTLSALGLLNQLLFHAETAGKTLGIWPLSSIHCTGLGLKASARLFECYRQAQVEVASNSNNKIHQTWPMPFSRAL